MTREWAAYDFRAWGGAGEGAEDSASNAFLGRRRGDGDVESFMRAASVACETRQAVAIVLTNEVPTWAERGRQSSFLCHDDLRRSL